MICPECDEVIDAIDRDDIPDLINASDILTDMISDMVYRHYITNQPIILKRKDIDKLEQAVNQLKQETSKL